MEFIRIYVAANFFQAGKVLCNMQSIEKSTKMELECCVLNIDAVNSLNKTQFSSFR